MISLLPDLAPRDSHALWYTSTRNPISSHEIHQQTPENPHSHQQPQNQQNQRRNAHIIDRSPLARLRADEIYVERRLHNVSDFGSTWLKPPGIPKTLYQLREERREQEEHQEALRREQLAQDLAEAEAAGPDGAPGNLDGQPSLLDDDVMLDVRGPLDVTISDGMSDVQLDGAQDGERDLDDDIPTADDDFALGSNEDDSDDDDSDDSDEQDEDELAEMRLQRAAQLQRDLMAQMMRRTQEARRQAVGLGDEDEVDEEDQEQMIEEDDVAVGDGDDMGMDVDLDDDIPEAQSVGGYEHTDTEAELSSSDADEAEMSFAADRAPHAVRFRGSLARTDATRNSIAVSDLLSRDGSSVLGSSPQVSRRG